MFSRVIRNTRVIRYNNEFFTRSFGHSKLALENKSLPQYITNQQILDRLKKLEKRLDEKSVTKNSKNLNPVKLEGRLDQFLPNKETLEKLAYFVPLMPKKNITIDDNFLKILKSIKNDSENLKKIKN